MGLGFGRLLWEYFFCKIIKPHIVWKLLKLSHLNFGILVFSTNFCPNKTDLSGNTVWPQASGFQKLAKMDHFWHFKLTFVHSKCKRSSLRSQCWMRLFQWFSNNVYCTVISDFAMIIKCPGRKNMWKLIKHNLVKIQIFWTLKKFVLHSALKKKSAML